MNNNRRFDRSRNTEFSHVTNHQIRVPNVRVIAADGSNIGIVTTREAIRLAQDQGLDLVIVSDKTDPPIAKIVEYSKFVYELKIEKKKQDRKNRENAITTKEIQLRPVTGSHDIEVKMTHAREFLEHNHKVKIVMKFRGREAGFSQKGFEVITQFIEGLQPCKVDKAPAMAGHNSIIAFVSPSKEKV